MFTDCKKKKFINNKLNYYKRKSAIKTSITTTAKDAYRVSFEIRPSFILLLDVHL